MLVSKPIHESLPADVRIHQARVEDLEEICNLLKAGELPTMNVETYVDSFLILDHAETIIGCVGLERYGAHGLLGSLVVEENHRHGGYGRRLCDAMCAQAEKLGVKTLVLLTETAQRFFAKRGFEVISRDDMDAHVKTSVEFESCCPASAVCMMKRLI